MDKKETQYLRSIGGEGILSREDIASLKSGVRRVYELMKDGRWYRSDQIMKAAGVDGIPASEGLRRMRELRKYGFRIRKIRPNQGRVFYYQISNPLLPGLEWSEKNADSN